MVSQPLHRSDPAPRRGARALAALVLAVVAVVLAGCGGEDPARSAVSGTELRVYSSMPLEGPDRQAALDVLRGERIALAEAGGRVGDYRVRLVSLDAATKEADRWDPAQISENARTAAKDPAAVAYVGEFHTGSSAISVPLLNEAGILQVSPIDSAMALTQRTLSVPDSPGKYYPKAEDYGRTFKRLVPGDQTQAAALLDYMRRQGVRRLMVLSDEDPTGLGYAMTLRNHARRWGIAVAGREDVDPHQRDPRDLIEKIEEARADAVFYGGAAHEGAIRLWQDLSVAAPTVKLFAPGSLVDGPFIDAIGAAGGATYVTRPFVGLRSYPEPAARFVRAYVKRHGTRPTTEALYGYEAMSAILAAIEDAAEQAGEQPLDRADVVRAFRALRREGTVLGDYEFRANGDTTLHRYGAYRVIGGELRYVHRLDA
ncbi:branched-chain amino acid ABC transporter substrate-binding protein [Conexibacter arvalis]|uniref:Branched-chain amino acid transport system substrate-binding protein n=1 Tax=Conexibacter arvalis TaxID=912552 RepID=A0A840IGT2_9ACTN|nr:branched-chain amino acid ABC transporter substrate-binding protein [Conexibacter arvalis]MBB4663986.1 branched-chain amino acid transport system substrate-binding protein [Conexibacter arvalis]